VRLPACRWLQSPRLGRWLALAALLLGAPGLTLGLQSDDYVHRAALIGLPGDDSFQRPFYDLFAFIHGGPETVQAMRDLGHLPWWSSDALNAALLRPTTGLTHWLDYQLFPDTIWAMHLHSLLWFALLAIAVTACYRRVLPGAAWTAGLAALLYVIDDARGVPVVWLANRNALIGMAIGLLALWSYDRWRRDGWRWGAWLAPALLVLAVLGNEGAVAIGGYLVAYALFLDRGPLARRLAALIPCVVVGVVWLVAYRTLGYGTEGSALYLDPVGEPLRFIREAPGRIVLLIWGQFAMPASDTAAILSLPYSSWFKILAAAFVVVPVVLFAPLVRREPVARFFALGGLLALVPVSAMVPSDRLLTYAGFGGMGLLAMFLASLRREPTGDAAAFLAKRPPWPRRAIGGVLILVHLVIAPLNLLMAAKTFRLVGQVLDSAMDSFPSDEAIRDQTVVIVLSPSGFLSVHAPLHYALQGLPVPRRATTLCSTFGPATATRVDEHNIDLRPAHGFMAFADGRTAQPGLAPIDIANVFAMLDRVFRDSDDLLAVGESVRLTGLTITVTEVDAAGRPAEVRYRFDAPLDSPALRWITWAPTGFEPTTPPAVGESKTYEAPRIASPF
jgi:hypothetical protein